MLVTGSPRRWPSTMRSPSLIASRPLMQRISVDLPEPLGPQTTTTSRGSTLSVMSFSTLSAPNHLLTPRKSIMPVLVGVGVLIFVRPLGFDVIAAPRHAPRPCGALAGG